MLGRFPEGGPVRYLVFDIETIVDWDLVYETIREHGESREDCIVRFTSEQIAKQNKDPPFIPARFHVPVSVAFIATDDHARYLAHKVVGGLDSKFVTNEFWSLIDQAPSAMGTTTLCTFNGFNFDMPVMEINAHRHMVKMVNWMVMHARYNADNPRNKWNESAHLDLNNFLAANGWVGGGLDYWSTLVGLPGKVCMDGSSVEAALEKEDGVRIVNDYCMTDVLNTYGLLIHTLRTSGRIDIDLPLAPHTYQMDAALEAILADPQWMDQGCVKRWAQAYREGKSGPVDDDEPPF